MFSVLKCRGLPRLGKYYRNRTVCSCPRKPQHLICFLQWNEDMVMNIVSSAITLKESCKSTHFQRWDVLENCKVTILKEVNEPILSQAVSKAATMLGAYDNTIWEHVEWGNDYTGRVLSTMTDIIFVSTLTHACVQRLAARASVPVVCMRSRTHASVQALATVMSVVEDFGCMRGLTVSYLGPPHPVLNSYLLLCPMLGANIKFKCCCQNKPISPLLYKESEKMVETTQTISRSCTAIPELIGGANVIIAGSRGDKDTHPELTVREKDITRNASKQWIFIHSDLRGLNPDDTLVTHTNTRTFNTFNNYQYIAAALMAFTVKNFKF
ncbi:ornithine transcarbamylase, mitochondrial [Plutella xylostella]|uniref:ornithine transcarbamylase, mitochondrial n=1 Tax=Plutella xylostella TaxID=51655 RepID=UPI002032509E|nr:ornithine transcarbamylase, mitochondrial [Plutella xylostella]